MQDPERERAVLVGIQLPQVSDEEHTGDLAELARLVRTLGFDVVATVTQRRDALAPAAVVGEGKLKDLAELTGGTGVVTATGGCGSAVGTGVLAGGGGATSAGFTAGEGDAGTGFAPVSILSMILSIQRKPKAV